MNTYRDRCNSQACGEQVARKVQPQLQHQQLKLALNVHAASIVVVCMVHGAKPQPPQTFKPAAFLTWFRKQQALAKEVGSYYEAGPTGFWLHRKLTGLGVRNYVVCPTRLEERYGGVANDGTDATELATRLDRYLAGNDQALAMLGVSEAGLKELPKSAPEKKVLAWWLRQRTTVPLRWLSGRLVMGHWTRVSQGVTQVRRRPGRKRERLQRKLLRLGCRRA